MSDVTGVYGTNFHESEAILAASADDFAELSRIVAGLDDGDLRALGRAAERVLEEIRVASHVRYGNRNGLLR
jgi:hypothetical protein